MWWCCGKRGKDQPGCKYSKHECKDDDEEEEDENEKEKNKAKQLKYIRCQCCKEMGHSIDDCPRDPNLKTRDVDCDEEYCRVSKLKDYRTLFGDTVVTTTHFLKKCVKVPKLFPQSVAQPQGLSPEKYDEMSYRQRIEPFKRGSMTFDDYNYDLYNKYILIDPNRGEDDQEEVDLGDFVPQVVMKTKKGVPMKNMNDDSQSLPLTERQLEQSCHDSYKHEALDIQTEVEKLNEEQEAKQKEQEQKNAEEAAKQKQQIEQQPSDQPSQSPKGSENESNMELEDEDPEIEYEVFYRSKDIKDTLVKQKKNHFTDILNEKKGLQREIRILGGPQAVNRFLIDDWAPKQPDQDQPIGR